MFATSRWLDRPPPAGDGLLTLLLLHDRDARCRIVPRHRRSRPFRVGERQLDRLVRCGRLVGIDRKRLLANAWRERDLSEIPRRPLEARVVVQGRDRVTAGDLAIDGEFLAL